MRKTNQAGVDLIKGFESLRLHAYQDSIGVWTIGYGHTGSDVHVGQVITEQQAEELLRRDLVKAESAVDIAIPDDATDNQFSACVSLAFNIGGGAFKHSTLVKMLQKSEVAEAADQFLKWNKAGGKVLAGLTRRREAERELFLTPDEPEAAPAPDMPESTPEPAPTTETVATSKSTIIEKTTNVVSGLAGDQQVKDIASQAVGKLATGASSIAGGAGVAAAADGAVSHNYWLIILAIVLALIGAAFVFYLLWHRSQKERLAAQINSDPSKADIRFVKG